MTVSMTLCDGLQFDTQYNNKKCDIQHYGTKQNNKYVKFSSMTLSITLNGECQHNIKNDCRYAECRCAECRGVN